MMVAQSGNSGHMALQKEVRVRVRVRVRVSPKPNPNLSQACPASRPPSASAPSSTLAKVRLRVDAWG